MNKGLAFSVPVTFVTVTVGVLWASPNLKSLVLTLLLVLIVLLIFVSTRHAQLLQARQHDIWPSPSPLTPSSSSGPARKPHSSHDYYLFVLGSGGHTREMLMMMDDGFCDFASVHRRYLISSGDTMSENHLQDYEKDLQSLCHTKGTSPGTYDVKWVTRARRVHQGLATVPFSAIRSVWDILAVLLWTAPRQERGRGTLKYPSIIFSNGPATGFFVGLTAHLLKIFYLVPEDCMRFVYIESWARISTLSLTGKLFHYSKIADLLLVQHTQVAEKYGVENAGPMVFNARRGPG